MAKESHSWIVAVLIAVISASAILGAAYIQSRNSKGVAESAIASSTGFKEDLAAEPTSAVPAPASLVTITGVQIGHAGENPPAFVVEHRTTFSESDVVAVTVHYRAGEEVTNFPVRLTAKLFTISQPAYERTADIAMAGDSFVTLRFVEPEPWMPGKYFLSIELDGAKAYSKEIDIN